MSVTKIIIALALLASVAATVNLTPTPSSAQSQPNYGPNSPGGGSERRIPPLPLMVHTATTPEPPTL